MRIASDMLVCKTDEADPFPPLAPEPTADTAADRVLDAALRELCAGKRRDGDVRR